MCWIILDYPLSLILVHSAVKNCSRTTHMPTIYRNGHFMVTHCGGLIRPRINYTQNLCRTIIMAWLKRKTCQKAGWVNRIVRSRRPFAVALWRQTATRQFQWVGIIHGCFFLLLSFSRTRATYPVQSGNGVGRDGGGGWLLQCAGNFFHKADWREKWK